MGLNRVLGDARVTVLLPTPAASVVNGSINDDVYIVPAGAVAGVPYCTLNLFGALANEQPSNGDRFEILDPMGVLSLARTLVIVGKIGPQGRQITDGAAAADSIVLNVAGSRRTLTFSSDTNTWVATDSSAGLISLGSVQNPADLTTTVSSASLPDGAVVHVESLEVGWTLDKEVTDVAVDGITCVATDTGVGRWYRNLNDTQSVKWLRSTKWFINATLGSDLNPGFATGAGALKTVAELNRRWGVDGFLNPSPAFTTVAAGSNGAVLPQATINVASTAGMPLSGTVFIASTTGLQTITYTGVTGTTFTGCTGGTGTLATGNQVIFNRILVTVETDLPSTDPLTFNIQLGSGMGLIFKGTNTTNITPGGAGVFSAVTPKNRLSVPPVANSFTDAGLAAGWAAFIPATGATPARVFDSTNNTYFWPLKVGGAGQARFTEPFTPQDVLSGNFPIITNASRPAAVVTVGDTYQIQQLTKLFLGSMSVTGTDNSTQTLAANGIANNIAFQDFDCRRVNAGPPSFCGEATLVGICFYGCILRTSVSNPSGFEGFNFENCILSRGTTLSSGLFRIRGGAIASRTTDAISAGNAFLFFDMDVILQGTQWGVFQSAVKIGTCGVFDMVANAPNNPNGDGIHVTPGGSICNVTFSDTTSQLWGAGNAGGGVGLGIGGTFQYTNLPNIYGSTPGTNDFILAGSTTSSPWDQTGNGGKGEWQVPIANSWPNLIAAAGPGGFGGCATKLPQVSVIGTGF